MKRLLKISAVFLFCLFVVLGTFSNPRHRKLYKYRHRHTDTDTCLNDTVIRYYEYYSM